MILARWRSFHATNESTSRRPAPAWRRWGRDCRALLVKRAAVMDVRHGFGQGVSPVERRGDPARPKAGWTTTVFASERSPPSGRDGISAFTIPHSTKIALASYSEQMHIAAMLGAQCVGFGWGKEFGWASPDIWSEETWKARVAAVAEMAEVAEREGIDIAAHPLYFTPLKSVERCRGPARLGRVAPAEDPSRPCEHVRAVHVLPHDRPREPCLRRAGRAHRVGTREGREDRGRRYREAGRRPRRAIPSFISTRPCPAPE